MIVVTPAGDTIDLGTVEATPTIGIIDYSRRVTDDFGVTTVVPRGFARRMSVRLAVPSGDVDALQRTLADLRAVAATWIAGARFQSLTVRGFFKDFSIDIANGSISYCTLTVEGLAVTESTADTGTDPAPEGKASTLRLLDPIVMTDAALVSTSVPESDHPEWAAGTGYGKGARVIKTATHRVYESAADSNVGNDPAGDSGKWLDIGPTNRWAAFDQALGTATTSSDRLVYTIDGAIGAVALLDVSADAVRVTADGYDRTQPAGPGAVTFLDLPTGTMRVTVALTGGQVAVGTLLAGQVAGLGVTEASPSAGITDYSRKTTDDFGDTTIVERAWAKRMAARALLRTDAIDDIVSRLATVRARPVLWLGREGQDSLTVYGLYKDFSVEAGQSVSKLSLTIEGLSKAAAVSPIIGQPGRDGVDGKDGKDGRDGRDGLNGSDGTPGAPGADGRASYLHTAYSNAADGSIDFTTGAPGSRKYLGVLVDFTPADSNTPTDYTWSLIKGADGLNGSDGTPGAPGANGLPTYVHIAYSNAADGSVDFSVDNPAGRSYVGFYVDQVLADSTDRTKYAWSLIKGAKGDPGENAPLVLVQWSVDGSTNWHFEYQTGDKFQRQSNNNGASWGPAVRVVGESAQSGVDGISPSIVFIRSATVPATPAQDTGNPPPGWSDDPPLGTTFLWQSVSKFRGGMQLEGWSTPVRISGADGKDGASAFTLIGNTGLALLIEPNRVTKVANGEDFQPEAVFRTAEVFTGGCQLSFYPGADTGPYFDFGLWDADRADVNGTGGIHADWTWHVVPLGNANDLQIYNRDVLKGAYGKVAGQLLGMAYDDRYVVATVSGIEVARFDVGAGKRFYARGAIRGNGRPISQIAWSKAGARGANGLDGTNGLNGTNGKSIHIAYADSANGQTNFTTGAAGGRFYIGVYTDTNPGADSTNPADYGWTLIRGANGNNGLPGPGGYVHIAYANSANGTVDFHLSDPTGRAYIGTYTDQTEPDSTNPAVYAWQLVKGADGAKGDKGDPGSNGTGINKPNVTAKPSANWAGTGWTLIATSPELAITGGQVVVSASVRYGANSLPGVTGQLSATIALTGGAEVQVGAIGAVGGRALPAGNGDPAAPDNAGLDVSTANNLTSGNYVIRLYARGDNANTAYIDPPRSVLTAMNN